MLSNLNPHGLRIQPEYTALHSSGPSIIQYDIQIITQMPSYVKQSNAFEGMIYPLESIVNQMLRREVIQIV